MAVNGIETIAIGQGGGPTAVINDEVAGALYQAKKRGVKNVYGLLNGLEGALYPYQGNIIDIADWNPMDLRGRPGAALGTTRANFKKEENGKKVLDSGKINLVKKNLMKLGIEGLIYFGGNDSSSVLQSLGNGFRAVHGAKTID